MNWEWCFKNQNGYEESWPIFYSPFSKHKFWGQNFYKGGRIVILEPEPEGKFVILYIYTNHEYSRVDFVTFV